MTPAATMQWAFAIMVLGTISIVLIYMLVRGVAFAYFRTKLEFLRRRRNLGQEE